MVIRIGSTSSLTVELVALPRSLALLCNFLKFNNALKTGYRSRKVEGYIKCIKVTRIFMFWNNLSNVFRNLRPLNECGVFPLLPG